ncbi:MAG: hypothetical protein WD397_04375, partial [Wenzhouxiangellaceae bacterium]
FLAAWREEMSSLCAHKFCGRAFGFPPNRGCEQPEYSRAEAKDMQQLGMGNQLVLSKIKGRRMIQGV